MVPFHRSLVTLAGSLGVVCVIVGVWGIVLKQRIPRNSFIITIALGLGLFLVLLLNPVIGAFQAVVPPMGMIVVLLIAFLGVIRRDTRASWIVLAVMILALATRVAQLQNLPMHPVDFYHYTLSLSLLCFGKSAQGLRQQT
ncbi:hypothetical protein GCM10027347_23930 [Larkinella harenae]